ncbi:MAG: FAD-dependent oxidoreductase [Planctomycetes bacterium]|nr:FAD-dependent oxidoreductase [Planctomycetota bacterium]
MSHASNSDKKIGAVLVVGGGIAGMQSALDLANAGFKVYLAEESPAIGGRMAQLDKTFPTNDCAMCTISPRLVEVEKHPNIEILTYSQVQAVSGQPGNFTAQILQQPRYVYLDKCNACGDCAAVCPVRLPNPFDEELGQMTAIHKHYPQAIPNKYVISKDGTSPCRIGCPAGVNAHAYVSLLSQKKYPEALEVIRRVLPFAAICGRLCHHPCETECNRQDVDESVSIRYLKRFIADTVRAKGEKPVEPMPVTKTEKIAVIGAGPAGLTCAQRLREKGFAVTIFEASDKPGGMLTSCIPDYRVPKEIAEYEISRILATGIELKTNTRIGRDISLAKIREQYSVVFMAVGYQEPSKIPLENSETKGVIYGVPFLREAKKEPLATRFSGQRVLVIGGGNVSMDCAKTALRLGAKEVSIVCLETRDLEHKDRMPAHEWEIEEAEEEGIKFNCLLGPAKVVVRDGKVAGLATTICESVYDFSSGFKKFAPKFTCNPGPTIEADTIIIATGQRTDLAGFEELEKGPANSVKANPITLETNIKGVFAGGDVARGPASVIEAVAHGNEAAISIERYLAGQDIKEGRGGKQIGVELPQGRIEKEIIKQRLAIPKESAEKRKKSFIEVEKLVDEEKAVAESARCLSCALCCECLQCVTACQPKAIEHNMKPQVRELAVGAVVLATGGDMFNAELKGEYGFGRLPNVVTSIQYERLLSASGPCVGQVLRPSDKKHPHKIAWVQCVGSRDHAIGNDYCSAVCCMYATKQAIITREHEPGVEVSIFYNDLRSFGKGYEYYTTSAKQKGIKYIKSIISSVKEIPETRSLLITYSDEATNTIKEEVVDMLVLSVGFTPSETGRQLCKNLSLTLNPYGFNNEGEFSYGATNKPGIYAAGVFTGPMDIPESVMGASGASALAGELLSSARNTMVRQKDYPPERDIKGEEARIGVFVCRCGTNIARVVDVQSLVDFAKKLPNVAFAEENLYTCSTDTQQHIIQMIQEHKLNRVIVSSCTPRTHEPLFQEMMCDAGLNKYLFEMANIRDQCSWVHMDLPLEATVKAKDLVKMAVGRARYLEPLKEQTFVVVPNALVIGGGLSGITSALSMARQGFMTYLVEKTDRLGGNLWNITQTANGQNPKEHLKQLLAEVENEPLLKVYKNATLKEITGSIGNYKSLIQCGDKTEEIQHGVVIVAIGGVEAKPGSYLYGQNPNVITQLQLEQQIAQVNPLKSVKSVVMIQCVEARDTEHPYCSRICCTQAIKNALRIKKQNPETNVYILYRDIMTYGMWEIYYRQAREAGVIFIRYDVDKKPQITQIKDGRLSVQLFDGLIQKDINIPTDLVVLSMPVRPQPDAQVLGTALKVPLNTEGFFLEAHLKLRPLDFANEGMFLAGLAHFPKHINESIAQGKGTAARAAAILSKKEMTISGIIAQVNPDECIACLTCVRECPFNVPKIVKNAKMKDGVITDSGVAFIEPSLCHGCGVCVSACPRKAINLAHYKDSQIVAKCEIYE